MQILRDHRALLFHADWVTNLTRLISHEGVPTKELLADIIGQVQTRLASQASLGKERATATLVAADDEGYAKAAMLAIKSLRKRKILEACRLGLMETDLVDLLAVLCEFGELAPEILEEMIEVLSENDLHTLIDPVIEAVFPLEWGEYPGQLQVRCRLLAYQHTKDPARLEPLRALMREWRQDGECASDQDPRDVPADSTHSLITAMSDGASETFAAIWALSHDAADLAEARRSAQTRNTLRGQIVAFLQVFDETHDPDDLWEAFDRISTLDLSKKKAQRLFNQAAQAFLNGCFGVKGSWTTHITWTDGIRTAFLERMKACSEHFAAFLANVYREAPHHAKPLAPPSDPSQS